MLDGVSDPILYGLAVVCFGGWVGLFWMVRLLFTGKLCTGRELLEKDARIAVVEQALSLRDEQIESALQVLPEVADILKKFHAAGEEMRRERAND